MTEKRDQIASRIKQARTHAGLDAEELARHVEVDWRTIYRWESAENAPRAKTLRRIAEATGVRQEWLTRGEGPMVSADTSPSSTADPAEPYRSAEDVPPGRYAHLVQAGATWDYELTDPDSGTVRAAVQIRFMVAPDVRRRQLSSSQADGASTE